jgi:F-type H+-transporting ATPase subunit epsilon
VKLRPSPQAPLSKEEGNKKNMTKKLSIVIVTPERAVLDEPAEMVVLPMFDGERGVQPGHSAFVGQLGPGSLRISTGGVSKKYYVDGGFVQCRGETVNVLTGKAVAAEAITPDVVKKAEAAATAMPETNAVEKDSKGKAFAKVKAMAKVGGVAI